MVTEGEVQYRMYEIKSNKEIGQYLSNRIDGKFESKRKFCIAYLQASGDSKPDDEKIRNMANRISQIINGNKEVQLYDFPVFTELLGVSCEEILSAGECSAPTVNHITNYSVAFSKDEAVWDEYVHREDKLILNLDEYGKTVIEYALDFKNFEFLKYLIRKKYIWFVDAVTDPKIYFRRYADFGVGASIERRLPQEHDEIRWYVSYPDNKWGIECRRPHQMDTLQYELAGNDNLRMRMISLSVEHEDMELLDQLRAREIPSLYQACYEACIVPDCNRYYDEEMVQCVARANEKILDYFSEEFEIKAVYGRSNEFLFPYMSELVDILIQKNSIYAEKMLLVSIEHNRKALKKLRELKKKTVNDRIHCFSVLCSDVEKVESMYMDEITDEVMRVLSFYDNGSIICYRDSAKNVKDGMITNIVHAREKSNDRKISSLIQKLNGLYDDIRNKKI